MELQNLVRALRRRVATGSTGAAPAAALGSAAAVTSLRPRSWAGSEPRAEAGQQAKRLRGGRESADAASSRVPVPPLLSYIRNPERQMGQNKGFSILLTSCRAWRRSCV